MSVAHVYAKALYEAAQEQREDPHKLEAELHSMLEMMKQSRDLEIALMGPLISSNEKIAVIGEMSKKAQFSSLTNDFLRLLARKNRFSVLRQIREAFFAVRLEGEGGVAAKVLSAEPLKDDELEALSVALRKKTGKVVSFQTAVDPKLLAGLKVTVGGVTYDGTLRAQLERLRDKVTQDY